MLQRPPRAEARRAARHGLTLAIVATLVSLASACGSPGADTATGKGGDASDTVTTTPLSTPDPAMFDDTLAGMFAELDAADGDLCRLFDVLDGARAAGNPTTEPQVREAFRFLGTAYMKVADATPPDLQAATPQIRASAQQMRDEADAPEIDVAASRTQGPAAFQDKAFLQAVSTYSGYVTSTCGTG